MAGRDGRNGVSAEDAKGMMMGKSTSIEWTATVLADGTVLPGHTWNPWRGCTHAVLADGSEHPGCANCYAEAMARRNPKVLGQWGGESSGGTRVLAAPKTFSAPVEWNADAERRGVRERVFLDSMHDLFEEWDGKVLDSQGRMMLNPEGRYETFDDLRRNVFRIIDRCPALDFLILTKRPGNILRMMHGFSTEPVPGHVSQNEGDGRQWIKRPNVWLGTSISDQRTADELVPQLLDARALSPVLFLSAEPLLGPINMRYYLGEQECFNIDWVIVGGESGPKARTCDIAWIRSLRDQCQRADVPVFVKQIGSRAIVWDQYEDGLGGITGGGGDRRWLTEDRKGGDWSEWPDDLKVRQFPNGVVA